MADDPATPRNRKERRAAARDSGQPIKPPTTEPKIKMAQPDRSGPKGKTLLDLAAERQSLLQHGQPFDPKHQDGAVRDEGGNILDAGLRGPDDADAEPIGPLGQSVFWTLALGMLHFTLDVLVYQQYAQAIVWRAIVQRTCTALPILFLLIFLLRGETAARFPRARQGFYLAVAAAAGCYTIHVANRYEYFAVMKQAPPLGTLWIWSVIEMKLGLAVVSVGVNLAFLWWMGYTML